MIRIEIYFNWKARLEKLYFLIARHPFHSEKRRWYARKKVLKYFLARYGEEYRVQVVPVPPEEKVPVSERLGDIPHNFCKESKKEKIRRLLLELKQANLPKPPEGT